MNFSTYHQSNIHVQYLVFKKKLVSSIITTYIHARIVNLAIFTICLIQNTTLVFQFWRFLCVYHVLVGTRDSRTQSARACKPALLHLALRTWVSGPRQTHRYRTPKALHPTVVLSFSRHFLFPRHFSLRPVVTNARTDAHTHATSDFIYKIMSNITMFPIRFQ
jgi:hypothetical protein